MVKNKLKRLSITAALVSSAFVLFTSPGYAQTARSTPVATEVFGSNTITWQPKVGYARLVLTVSGPGDFYLSQEFEPGGSPSLKTTDDDGKSIPNGSYTYELLVVPDISGEARTAMNSSRQSGSQGFDGGRQVTSSRNNRQVQSGHFRILKGELVQPNKVQEER